MNFREGILDRVEDSFSILFKSKNNFIKLISLIFVYKLFIGIILWNIVSYVLLGNLDVNSDFFNPYYIIIFFFIIVGFLFYITFFIAVYLTTIKNIKDIINQKEIDLKQNLKYGFNNIIPSFNTYWYIFAYITLWPFLFIAVGGIMLIFGMTLYLDILESIGFKIMIFGFLFLLFFMIYRGVKTYFSLISAVDKNCFTKENFLISINITKNNWWRIVGNFILVSLIISIILGLISSILSIFKTGILDIINIQELLKKYFEQSISQEYIDNLKTNILEFYDSFYLNNFLLSIVDLFLETIKNVFLIIFTYLFFKRLKVDYKGIEKQNLIKREKNNENKIEL